MTVHANSMTAYHEEREQLSQRARTILNLMSDGGKRTDREIMKALRFSEPNAVRPRVTELIQKCILMECGTTRCKVSGKTVRLVAIPDMQAGQLELFG